MPKNSSRKGTARWTMTFATLVLLAGAGAAWYAIANAKDPGVAEVEQLQQQLAKLRDTADASPQTGTEGEIEEERRRLQEEVQAKRAELDEGQRRQLRETQRAISRERLAERIAEYEALPETERMAYLDRAIDRQEERREQLEQRRAKNQATNGGGDSSSSRGNAPGGGHRRRSQLQNLNDDQRQQRQRDRLSNTDPKQRASRAAYMDAINKRRKERGLEPVGPTQR